MTTSDEQYVPSEEEMRHAYWLTRMLDHYAAVDAAFDRFLARVRRDAAREALGGLEEFIRTDMDEPHGDRAASRVWGFRDTHYPETEDQT